MKRTIAVFILAVCAVQVGRCEMRDPTVPTAAMADLLRRGLREAPEMRLHALVVGGSGEGVALVGETAKDAVAVRRGGTLAGTVEGVRVTAEIRSVTTAGVELVSGTKTGRIVLPGSCTPLAPPTNAPAAFVRHLESERVPVARLLRLVADQTGVNISSSAATAEKTVTIFLRNVPAEAAVEEICRTTGLWFRRDPEGGVIRVTTMAEYAENLSTFREDTTKSFTLLYPNVVEIASVIYGLYPERTLVSLGEEEFQEDDEYDLSRRFRRFRVIEENGNSQFMDMQAPQSSSSSGTRGGGEFSFSRGNALSRLTQWDRLRDRSRIATGRGSYATPDAMLSAAAAKELDTAVRTGDTNAYERVYRKNAPGAANIFVSLSRRNNRLIVRTSDVKAMDEITRLVKELDVPTPMVLLELRVLELTLDDNFNAKFEWSFNDAGNLNSQSAFDFLGEGEHGGQILGTVGAGAMNTFEPTFSFMTLSRHVLSKIELLAQDGKIKTLATPTLLVANNEVSRIFSGKEYPLVSGWTPGAAATSESGYTVGSTDATVQIEKKDVGDMLLISPNINADKTITLRLLQENSAVAGKVSIPVTGGSGSEKDIDYVESRSLTGTFVAKDNMTVMAGGLIKEKESEQYYRTPVIGSIPLLGWLFRGTEKVKQRTEMIILIKPHVVMTPMEGGKISKKLMRELSDHPAADGRGNMGVFREGKDPTAKEHTVKDDIKSLMK